MTDEQLTALAREYAKECCPIEAYEELIPFDKDDVIERKIDILAVEMQMEQIFEWLSRRFFLIEKETVRKEYRKATAHVAEAIKSKNPLSESCGKGKRIAIQSLFPEIAKEVRDGLV